MRKQATRLNVETISQTWLINEAGGSNQQTGLINYRVTFMDSNLLVDIMANEYA